MWESIVLGFRMLFSKSKGNSDKGYIHIVTPELEVKADFKDEESMRRVQQIIDNEIELRFNRLEELIR